MMLKDIIALRIGLRIKNMRKRAGLTQNELTELIGINSRSHLSDIEKGKKMPSLELLYKIEAHLDTGIVRTKWGHE